MAGNEASEEWRVLWAEITDAFSPGAPVQERDLFAGRIDQLASLMDAVQQRGRHAIVFGERGVGKTSITNILGLILRGPRRNVLPIKVNADPEDTFTTLWKKVFRRLTLEASKVGLQIPSGICNEDSADKLTPDDVQHALSGFPATQTPLIILDEFDRISDRTVTVLIADTIKALSDYSVNATIITVGVAKDVNQLIEGHESIARSLIQVKMPRMSQDELGEIIISRYKKCGIKANEESIWKMTFLARGLPYYAQLIGMHAARAAISRLKKAVTPNEVDAGMANAVAELDQSIKENTTRQFEANEAKMRFTRLCCSLAL